MLEAPSGRCARCCTEGGLAGGFDLRTLWKAPLSTSGLSEKTLTDPHPQPVLPPAAWGGHVPLTTLVEPSWSQAGTSPPRLSATPQTWVQCLLSHSNASNKGPCRRPRCGQAGHWEGSCPLSPILTLTGEGRASQGRRDPVSPLRVSDRVSDRGCVRTSSFLSVTCLPPAQRALRRQEHIYFQSETISPRERTISERSQNSDLNLTRFCFLFF